MQIFQRANNLLHPTHLHQLSNIRRGWNFRFPGIETIHDSFFVLNMLYAESMSELMREDTSELYIASKFIDIDSCTGLIAYIFTLAKFFSMRSFCGIKSFYIEFHIGYERIYLISQSIAFFDLFIEKYSL